MAKREKRKFAAEELSAPFYMLTYGDMMTLLLTFFVLLFSMSTIQIVKFQAQIGAIRGALGISSLFSHAPLQTQMPAPSVKESSRIIARSHVKPTTLRPLAEFTRIDLTEPVQFDENEKIKLIKALGSEGDIEIRQEEDDIILVLPSYGVFSKGSANIDTRNPSVQKLQGIYGKLAQQINMLTDYEIHFVGHTDSIQLPSHLPGPKTNTELGFRRAVAMYETFFNANLKDKTRIIFGSQGDNVPMIRNASLDSERRKNRRVEIYLRKKRRNKNDLLPQNFHESITER